MSKEEKTQTFAVGQECIIIVESTSGDVDVEGWDQAQLAVESPDERVAVKQDGATWRISPGGNDVKVRIPLQSDLSLRLVSGDVRISDIAGQVSVETMSGDIEAKRLQGELKVHSVSGDLEVRTSHLTSMSVDTVSGDSEIETSLGTEGTYRFHSVSGDMDLSLPPEQSCTLRSTSLSGDFKCELPHEVQHKSWGKLVVLINGGGPEFQVRTASSSIVVAASKALGEQQAPVEEPFRAETHPEQAQPTVARETKPLGEAFEAGPEPFSLSEEQADTPAARRMEVLKAIEEGKISVSEGLAKLRALG